MLLAGKWRVEHWKLAWSLVQLSFQAIHQTLWRRALILETPTTVPLKPKKFMSAEFRSPKFRNLVLVKTEIPIHQNTNWVSKSQTFQQISAELGEKVKSHLNYDHRYKKGWARRIDRNPKMRNLLTQKKLEKKKKKHNCDRVFQNWGALVSGTRNKVIVFNFIICKILFF